MVSRLFDREVLCEHQSVLLFVRRVRWLQSCEKSLIARLKHFEAKSTSQVTMKLPFQSLELLFDVLILNFPSELLTQT